MFLVWLMLVLYALMAVAAFLPREERPNARVVVKQGSSLRAEITCRDCGARRVITFTAGQEVAAATCLECGVNIVPVFDQESQHLIAASIEKR